jgi:hypothetical protein
MADSDATMQIVAAILTASMINPSQIRDQHEKVVGLYLKTLRELDRRAAKNPQE